MSSPLFPQDRMTKKAFTVLSGPAFDDETVEIRFQTDGYYTCSYHESPWCGHIEQFFKDGADAVPFWDYLQGIVNEAVIALQVPIVMEANLFQKVEVSPFRLNGSPVVNAFDAHMVIPYGYLHSAADWETSLGIFGVYDGMMAVRQGVYYLSDALMQADPKCPNTAHSFESQIKLERRRQMGGQVFWQERFCIAATKKCISCHTKSKKMNPDDLIPDAGNTKTWSR